MTLTVFSVWPALQVEWHHSEAVIYIDPSAAHPEYQAMHDMIAILKCHGQQLNIDRVTVALAEKGTIWDSIKCSLLCMEQCLIHSVPNNIYTRIIMYTHFFWKKHYHKKLILFHTTIFPKCIAGHIDTWYSINIPDVKLVQSWIGSGDQFPPLSQTDCVVEFSCGHVILISIPSKVLV